MFPRFLLARTTPRTLSSALKFSVHSRLLSTLRFAHPVQNALPSLNSRWFSVAPALRAENRDGGRTSAAPSGSCYIANVPYDVTAEQLKDAFSEFGGVKSVNLLTASNGMPRGAGFVRFESVEDAIKFVKANQADPIFVLDRQLLVQHAQGTRSEPKPTEPSNTLRIPNSQGRSDADVRSMFGSHADSIMAVRFHERIADQRTAFVQFRAVDLATEAMEAFKRQNQAIPISYAIQRQNPANPYTLVSRLSKIGGQ